MVSFFRHKAYINIIMLLRVVGWLLMVETAFMLIPFVVALGLNESSAWDFLICLGITGGCSAIMMSLKPKTREMGKREAILLTSMTWVILSLFGMMPFLICGTHLNVTDAFFETMSGFTTTGASVLNTVTDVPKSILLWRCIIQWIGGLGIILFTLAVVPMLNYQGGMQLFNAEVTGITHDKLRPRVSYTAKGLWTVYILLTAILIVFLSMSRMDFFDAVCYGLSTMSTGGFTNTDMNIDEWQNMYIKTVMTIFMFLGGVNFSLIFNAATGRVKSLFKNDALKWYVFSIVICYLLMCLNILITHNGSELADFTIDPLFQTVSILSSTGLVEPDFHNWGALAMIILPLMMFMGACAGSTSGGAKIDRFIIMVKYIKNEFYKMMHPNSVTTVCINGKGTNQSVVQKTLAFLFLYIIVIIFGGVILTCLGMSVEDSFFCSLSAISNTGLGTETTGISGNFALVPDAAKWLLSFIMLVGRLELFTVLLLFTTTFWKK